MPTLTPHAHLEPSAPVANAKPLMSWPAYYNGLPPRQRAGAILKLARLCKHLTLEKLAERADIRKSDLAEMEAGFREIEEEEAQQIAEVLGMDFHPLLETYVAL